MSSFVFEFFSTCIISSGILDKVMIPSRRLDWSPETRRTFARSITREKNFVAVSKRTNKTTGDCQAYYYSSFKGTREYSIVKRHPKTNVRTRSSNVGASAWLYLLRWRRSMHIGCVTMYPATSSSSITPQAWRFFSPQWSDGERCFQRKDYMVHY